MRSGRDVVFSHLDSKLLGKIPSFFIFCAAKYIIELSK